MSRRSKPAVRVTWCWRRWIVPGQQESWIARLQGAGCLTWTLTERPDRVRILLAVYASERARAVSLRRQFGGQVRGIKESEWINASPAAPTRIGRRIEIVHEKTSGKNQAGVPRLHVPHGMAFGSGDHATTHMLLLALARLDDWSITTVLDLGTGSGVLALAARRFGARRITATDFDADAVRTARQNEELNFPTPLIRWQCADVRQLRAAPRYNLVLANLFSGILCEAAPRIAASVAPDGSLWLSGILRSQRESVISAYGGEHLQLVRGVSRGKWVMLQFRKTRSG